MARTQASSHAGALLAVQRVTPYEHRGLAVRSDAVDEEGRLKDAYSAYHDDRAPGLSWSRVIDAQSYALVVQDPDAPRDQPVLHWLMWNIPADATQIPEDLPRIPRPRELSGAVQGLNTGGEAGWQGAKPPPGHGLHHYHFQLFALAERLDHLSPDTPLETLISALKGLTITAGELVGTYEQPDTLASAASERFGDERGGLDRDDVDRHAPHQPGGEVLRKKD